MYVSLKNEQKKPNFLAEVQFAKFYVVAPARLLSNEAGIRLDDTH